MVDIGTRIDHGLIASDRVEGTAVYDLNGERLGSISRLLIGKSDGQVACAVLSFGGFLGVGNDHYPVPWDMLRYDVQRGGYLVDLDKDRLKDAPRYNNLDRDPAFTESYTAALQSFYGMNPLL